MDRPGRRLQRAEPFRSFTGFPVTPTVQQDWGHLSHVAGRLAAGILIVKEFQGLTRPGVAGGQQSIQNDTKAVDTSRSPKVERRLTNIVRNGTFSWGGRTCKPQHERESSG